MKDRTPKAGLWRDRPLDFPLKSGERPFPLEKVFPSGRQALSYSLSYVGLSRSHRVAFPEWSSHCVVSAIGRCSTPIPISEVLKNKINVDSVLVYEQWGWPITNKIMEQLGDYFKRTVFILDMVDSAYFKPNCEVSDSNSKAFIRIASLSKLLGLTGGGLAVADGKYLSFAPESEAEELLATLEQQDLLDQHPYGFVATLMKDSVMAVPLKLREWINTNDLFGAVECERILRQKNIKTILDSPLTSAWPTWMKEAVEDGAGPGMAPILRGYAEDILVAVKESLMSLHAVETCIYHFNWSGDPLKPAYERCLAFPVHGLVQDAGEILESIKT